MPLKFLSLLIVILVLGGCTTFDEPDFDKPLIAISQNKEAKSPQQQAWVETKTSRIWVNPYVDGNGDYVEGHYKYTVLEPGHWVSNGNQTKQQ